MTAFRLEPGANSCLDDIYDYTAARWGLRQADDYVLALFDEFGAIAEKRVSWRPIASALGVDGFYRRSRHHFIYWKVGADGRIAILAILHERMHQASQLHEAITDDGSEVL
ncbi:MAG: type II toxin-antitoxin system RelE/ParE family toxin [Sphingomonas sp.]